MSHTEGKWYIEETESEGKEYKINTDTPRKNADGHDINHQANGANWICSIWTPKTGEKYSHGHCKRTLKDYKEAEANAHRIVQCCNSHDALVDRIEALEELLVCYRIGRRPTEKLHKKLDKTKAALQQGGSDE